MNWLKNLTRFSIGRNSGVRSLPNGETPDYSQFTKKELIKRKNEIQNEILKVDLEQRTRIAVLEKALKDIGATCRRETNGLEEYDMDSYGYCLKIVKKALNGKN